MSILPCPNCDAQVDNQFGFGMVTCPKCNHIFMTEEASLGDHTSIRIDVEAPEGIGVLSEPRIPKPGTIPPADESESPMGDLSFEVIDSSEPSADQHFDSPLEVEIPSAPDGETFDDVKKFGNAEIVANSSSGLFYDVEISGIDSPESRKELERILADKKLDLAPSLLISKIKDGTLNLKQLHPVRAAVLVNRLKATHLKVKWTTDQMIKVILVFCIFFCGFKSYSNEWDRHETSLKDHSIKINNYQDDIHELIVKKKAEPDPKVRENLLEEIKKKYFELTTAHKEMLKEIEHVRFEHPEKGDRADRKYRHIRIKTLEELEGDSTLDGQLSKIKKKAEDRYQRP